MARKAQSSLPILAIHLSKMSQVAAQNLISLINLIDCMAHMAGRRFTVGDTIYTQETSQL